MIDHLRPGDELMFFCFCERCQGAAVLRMLSDFITEKVFSTGLRVSTAATPPRPRPPLEGSHLHQRLLLCPQTYLKEFEYNSTIYTDLWKHLQMVTPEAPLPNQPALVLDLEQH